MKVLLVQPDFPVPVRSINHSAFLPIGLLKIASYHRARRDKVRLVNGNNRISRFYPDVIKITSLFTYWSQYVWNSVEYYKGAYPKAKVVVGGIYASLMPEHCKRSGCDEVFVGLDHQAEKCQPLYRLIDVDYQVVHTSRGCTRRCKFCGTWRLEPKLTFKQSILPEICRNKIVFYDNNLLANPYIEDILEELAEAKNNGRVITADSQCGIDGRLLTPRLANLLRKARFVDPKIAWDGPYRDHKRIKDQIDMLVSVGFRPRYICVFMLYNYKLDYYEMLKKVERCKKWGVQIADCRFRPLDQTYDNYNPKKKQTRQDYYIHPHWTDRQIKRLRSKVREQNIMIRYRFSHYSREMELLGKRLRSKRLKRA